jgi:hypothetical protein
MGTTTKGLRYPEANVLGNTLHTRIKELADDMNAALVSRDTRFDGLDTKTNTTNTVLAARGLPISRHNGWVATSTNLPNNSSVYTTHLVSNPMIVPTGARVAVVSMQCNSRCETNAQMHWQPCVNFNAGWIGLWGNTAYASVHNQGQPALNMGFAVTAAFDVRDRVGQYTSLAVNAHNDTGSGAWIHIGYMSWSVTFES